jgi:hypothetical protein
MVNIDKTNLKQKFKDAEMHPNLLGYVTEVALIKPTCDFFVNDECVQTGWRRDDSGNTEDYKQIYRVNVGEDGETIGFLSIVRQYRNGANEDVFGVGSFRINKSRGRGDETTTKHLKVALRNVKKLIVGRDYTELADLIKDGVTNSIHSLTYNARNHIKWGVDQEELAIDYALLALEHETVPRFVLGIDLSHLLMQGCVVFGRAEGRQEVEAQVRQEGTQVSREELG